MKKLTKLNLNELAKVMPVINENVQSRFIGGNDERDCWWRCVAYLKSCGEGYSEEDAKKLAREYYGANFDENSYAFSGNYYDHKSYISGYVTNEDHCSGRILVFDPASISGWEGITGMSHAVVVEGYDSSGYATVFDPQQGEYIQMSLSDINSSKGFYVDVK